MEGHECLLSTIMTRRLPTIRFLLQEYTSEDAKQRAASDINEFFVSKDIRVYDYYFPHQDPKLVVFKFPSAHVKEKALLLERLDRALSRANFAPLSDIGNNNNDHRTIFVNRLSPNNFYLFTITENGTQRTETLDKKCDALIASIKSNQRRCRH